MEGHGPLGARLLRKLCGRIPVLLGAAFRAAHRSIQTRLSLWDGLLEAASS